MSSDVEQAVLLWTQIGAIGQIAGAIATAAAVIASLWIVLSERRERVRLAVGHRLLLTGDAVEDRIELCQFDLTNTGERPVIISGVGWRIGWSRRGPSWLRYRYALQQTYEPGIGSSSAPVQLGVGHRTMFNIRMSRFEEPTAAVPDLFAPRHLPFGIRVTPPIFGQAFTSRGTTFVAKAEPELRAKIILRVAAQVAAANALQAAVATDESHDASAT